MDEKQLRIECINAVLTVLNKNLELAVKEKLSKKRTYLISLINREIDKQQEELLMITRKKINFFVYFNIINFFNKEKENDTATN